MNTAKKAEGFTKDELRFEVQTAIDEMQPLLVRILRPIKSSSRKLRANVEESIEIFTNGILQSVDKTCPDVVRSCTDFVKSKKAVEGQIQRASALLNQTGDPSGQVTHILGIIRVVKQWATDRLSIDGKPIFDVGDATEKQIPRIAAQRPRNNNVATASVNTPESMHDINRLLGDLGISDVEQCDFIQRKCMTLSSSYYWAFLMEMAERAPFNTAEDVPEALPRTIHLLYIHLRDALFAATHVSTTPDFPSLQSSILQSLSLEKYAVSFLNSDTIDAFEKAVLAPVRRVISAQTDSETFVLWLADMADPVEDFSTPESVSSILLINKPKNSIDVPVHEYEQRWVRDKLPFQKPEAIKMIRKDRNQLKVWAKRMKEDIQVDALPLRTFEFMRTLINTIVAERALENPVTVSVPVLVSEVPDEVMQEVVANSTAMKIIPTENGQGAKITNTVVASIVKDTPDTADIDLAAQEPTDFEKRILKFAPKRISSTEVDSLLYSINKKRKQPGILPRDETWIRQQLIVHHPGITFLKPRVAAVPDLERVAISVPEQRDVDREVPDVAPQQRVESAPVAVTDIPTDSAVRSPEVEAVAEVIDPLAAVVSNLSREATVQALLETKCDSEQLEELVMDLSVLHGDFRQPLNTDIVRALLLQSLEYHAVLNRIGIASSKEYPRAWMIGVVRNAVYGGTLPSDSEGGRAIKDAIAWLMVQLESHAVQLAEYIAYRKSLMLSPVLQRATPVAEEAGVPVSESVTINEPVQALAAEKVEISEKNAKADTVAQEVSVPFAHAEAPVAATERVPDIVTDEVSEQVSIAIPEETALEPPVEVEGGTVATVADVATEDLVAQRLREWWGEFTEKMRTVMNTPNLVAKSIDELLSQMNLWEQAFETLMDEMDEHLSAEKDAVRFVQSAHLFSKQIASERAESHIRLDNFQSQIAVLQKHDVRTKAMASLRDELKQMEKAINEQKSAVNTAKTDLSTMRSKVLELPLDLIDADANIQIVAPSSLAEAQEKLRELQVMFEGQWREHLSIRTAAYPVDLPPGSIDDILRNAKEAHAVFSGLENNVTHRSTIKNKKGNTVSISHTIEAFPALTLLQHRCLQILTAQTLDKKDLRNFTWGHTAAKIQKYWILVFPQEEVPLVEMIAAALSDPLLAEVFSEDDIVQPTREMRQAQKPVAIWEKRMGTAGVNRLFMATHLAFDWSVVKDVTLADEPLMALKVKRDEERDLNKKIKAQRTRGNSDVKKPRKKKV